jgi:predicted Zn-dependent protease with MMP-like domain
MAEFDRLLDEAERALDDNQPRTALALAQEAGALDPTSVEPIYLQAEALLDTGEFVAAEPLYRRADDMAPNEPAILSGRGICLFELVQLEAAEQVLRLALELDSRQAEAHHHLGLTLEHLDRAQEAEQHLRRARKLAPETYHPAIEMAESDFDACVESALVDLPEPIRQALENVSVTVEPLPRSADLLAGEPPLSPQILGMWRGTALTDKTVFDPWTELPGEIVLYQTNLQRFARDRTDLIEQIRVTVLHEVGHALGLNEEDLDDRGLA